MWGLWKPICAQLKDKPPLAPLPAPAGGQLGRLSLHKKGVYSPHPLQIWPQNIIDNKEHPKGFGQEARGTGDFLPESRGACLPGGITKNFFYFQDKNLHDSYTQDLAVAEGRLGFLLSPFPNGSVSSSFYSAAAFQMCYLAPPHHCALDVH